MGLHASFFDRKKEREYISKEEGYSLKRVIESILKEEKGMPDVIYDKGDVGKEPMVRIIGRDAKEVVEKVIKDCQFRIFELIR